MLYHSSLSHSNPSTSRFLHLGNKRSKRPVKAQNQKPQLSTFRFPPKKKQSKNSSVPLCSTPQFFPNQRSPFCTAVTQESIIPNPPGVLPVASGKMRFKNPCTPPLANCYYQPQSKDRVNHRLTSSKAKSDTAARRVFEFISCKKINPLKPNFT